MYYPGDYDPSGLDISRNVEKGLREFAGSANITFERIAVTQQRIEDLHLFTRPTKKTDSRSKGFSDKSVEVDAIRLDYLRELVRDCIEQHIDQRQLAQTRKSEEMERLTLMNIVEQLSGN